MRRLIHKYEFYWPKMEQDCIRYAKGCDACQRCGPIQHVPAKELNSIIKPWPFRGWAMDLIGEIYPSLSDCHTFVIIATCYFTEWGTMFTGGDMVEWASQMKIKLPHSTPYYAQANGQVEATNKTIKLIVQNMIEDNPRRWHVLLSETVWANITNQKLATGTSPFRMVYGNDTMLPMELSVMSTRCLHQRKFVSG
ncbi:uncharacterized protein LOC126678287 [Mercurialis annua]|uniref:uncharacterized protein LOC126678287 n=1 Tax=Mercurialis annua TaxID=3986 RepID=UPI00215E38B3|nr:uncharacterized protein LOC126678287 [Mercurialis annua]